MQTYHTQQATWLERQHAVQTCLQGDWRDQGTRHCCTGGRVSWEMTGGDVGPLLSPGRGCRKHSLEAMRHHIMASQG